ncbi:MAG TPA: thiamine-phosphate kinase [bacterium]|nr:thiamine-phosphate kinase [bacterium]
MKRREGEFALIERIRRILKNPPQTPVIPLGDDCAAVNMTPGFHTLFTTDAMVEGVHFDLRYTDWEDVGWKVMAVNVSDIAAMGGRPAWGVVTLGIPGICRPEAIDRLYSGMEKCSRTYQFSIIGGDTVHSPHAAFVSVAMLGEVEPNRLSRRSGAAAGDLLCVSGRLGGSRVALEALSSGADAGPFPGSVRRFLRPEPRLLLARWLAEQGAVTSMIDISDGLASEIHHLCRENRLGCRVRREAIPCADEVKLWTGRDNDPEYVLNSGEEYELLFTAPPSFNAAWASRENPERLPLTVLGEMTAGKKIWLENGSRDKLEQAGWDHFRSIKSGF